MAYESLQPEAYSRKPEAKSRKQKADCRLPITPLFSAVNDAPFHQKGRWHFYLLRRAVITAANVFMQ